MDFPKSEATTQAQDTRAWCVDTAVRACLGESAEDIVKAARQIEEYVTNGASDG